MLITKKLFYIIIAALSLLSLVACSNNLAQENLEPNYSPPSMPLIQAADLAFDNISVGDSIADVLEQFGEPDWLDEFIGFHGYEYTHFGYPYFSFMALEGRIIAYTVDAALDFRPLGVSIGDTFEDSIRLLEQLGLSIITVTTSINDDGLFEAYPQLDDLLPNTAYLMINLGNDYLGISGETNILITTEKVGPTLLIHFRADIVDLLQVSLSY